MTLQERFEALDLAAIERFIDEQHEENLHLDFKTADARFSRDDRRNLAEATSGFANADGGLIIWGIDARPNHQGTDAASGRREVSPLGLFISKLNEHSGDAASPIVDGVIHKRIATQDDSGFAVTFVPASDGGPHMAKLGVDRYFKRSGSQFRRMQHFEVEDMFGRRRRPVLSLGRRAMIASSRGDGEISYKVILLIENSGRGSARAPFLGLRIEPPYRLSEYGLDGNYNQGLPRLITAHGIADVRFGGMADLVVHPGVVHEVTAVHGTLPASRKTLDDLVVHFSLGAEDARIRSGTLRIPGSEVVDALRGRRA